jgi:hypothetical protein
MRIKIGPTVKITRSSAIAAVKKGLEGKVARVTVLVLTVWFAVALMGYGMALRKYARHPAFRQPAVLGPILGPIESITPSFLRFFGTSFKLSGKPDAYYIPNEFAVAERASINRILKSGTPVSFSYMVDTNLILSLTVHQGTPGERMLVNSRDALAVLPTYPALLTERGASLVKFGLALVPLFLGAYWLIRKKFKFRSR